MKKIKYNILKGVMLLGLASTPFIATSCRQELDINVSPNTSATASVSGLLTGAQIGLAYNLGGEATRMSASVVQHYAGYKDTPRKFARYDISTSDTEDLWKSLYSILMDLKEMENLATESGEQVYVGTSKILQAYAFSVLTDLYGDIPFSEALQGNDNITPAYDTQESIYPQLITMIEDGITAVKSGKGTISSSADLIYKGDVSKWEKFANSLKLRLLNHLSKKDGGAAAAAFLAQNPSLIEEYSDNAKVSFGTSASSANPIYQYNQALNLIVVTNTLVDKMEELSDPRMKVYFTANSSGEYLGNTPGKGISSGSDNYSRVGSAYASINAPVVLMSAAEVNFIKAEVYLNNGGDAQTAYETAITQDFLALGLSSSDVATYLENEGVAYDGTLERIMEQKWITMFQSSTESWSDWRRTGYPTLSPSSGNKTGGVIPRRLPYPDIEISVNRNNLIAGPGIPTARESLLNPVWWDED